MSDVEEGYATLEEAEEQERRATARDNDEAAGPSPPNYTDDEMYEHFQNHQRFEELQRNGDASREADQAKRCLFYDAQMCCYYAGAEALEAARLWIAEYTLPKTEARLKKLRANPLQTPKQELKSVTLYNGRKDSVGALTFCAFSPDSKQLVTGSSAGLCKIWKVPGCQLKQILTGHNSNIGAIVFHPKATTEEESLCNLASCAGDNTVKLWNLASHEPIADIDIHMPLKVAFHPSGRFLGTCCFDSSWRLWDLERCAELVKQEGCQKPVSCISFQNDGAVCATGSLDSFGRIWDLRTGWCIFLMEAHERPIYGIDFSPNGYHIASVSQDNTCKIWDMRKRNVICTIPAHTSNISGVKYQKNTGGYLVTGSYDRTIKIWKESSGELLETLPSHGDRVSSVDVSPDNQFVASTSYDGTFKLWGANDLTL